MNSTPLQDLSKVLRLDLSNAEIDGSEPETTSPHRLAECMAAAMAAHGLAAAGFGALRGGPTRSVRVRTEDALLQLMAVFATRIGDVPAASTMEDPHLLSDSDFYTCRDGREIFILLSFPHLRDRALRVLGCAPGTDRIAAAAAGWDALALEEAIVAAGGTATMVRSREEWAASAAGHAIAGEPLVRIECTGDASPVGRAALAPSDPPLSGVRVIDFTHVIAGPIAARLLAELGAEVLHVSRPDRADPNAMIIETGVGKRNAFCDLRTAAGKAQFDDVLAGADIVIHSYRHLARFGLDAAQLATEHPGLVFADVHGWGDRGPWADRGGFDQLACSATGFALEEGGGEHAALPPTYLLNDYVAGFLLAAGIETALTRQATDGGSWHVHVDLARVCTWVQSFGQNPNQITAGPDLRAGLAAVDTVQIDGPFGRISALPSFVQITPPWDSVRGVPSPLGSSAMKWSDAH
ncbi:CoA transferase [Curtobacterium sp. 1544]|jgi:crotonobetainyl-CoA:carnitine CoA-transferase CaiB-like acyl-CoA transferase|uniref:CoA transferase n=2 Tax=Microbacteriaceae TaxID=85023 RepID=UPI003390C18C